MMSGPDISGRRRRMSKSYKMIDLFSGAGGMTFGFRQAGFEPILAVEKEQDFAATYAENFGSHVIAQDIAEVIDAGGINVRADIVVGGPPCQGFSNLTGNRANDPRRAMWRFFMEVVESTDCKVFVCENVPNLLTSAEGHGIINRARHLGFHVGDDSFGIYKASDFGVSHNPRIALVFWTKKNILFYGYL
jgi:DNA (cytosine-5)-methyltransferase 1